MNKQELTRVLRPLIKECIKEIMYEDGTLSKIISEVVVGLKTSEILSESSPPPVRSTAPASHPRPDAGSKKLEETRKRVLNSIGRDAYAGVDLFEGTTPLSSGGSPGVTATPSSPLAGIDPADSGVDISEVFPGAEALWKKLM